MLKESIKQLFQNYEQNKITDIPVVKFKPTRNPFEYLPPQRILFKDLRVLLKPKQTTIDTKAESITEKFERYAKQFEFRNSYKLRIATHTLQYTALSFLIIFGFYSRQFTGLKRCQHVLKETLKTAFYSGSIFTVNELLYPLNYKLSSEMLQKPMFTTNNLLSTLFVWPIVFLVQWNLLLSIRKSLFICAFGQIRDFQTQNQRFFKLNPDHISTKGKYEAQRMKHPFQDPSKRPLASMNSKAQQERRKQERQELQRQALAKNKGQKIPSTHLFMILPEIYRHPTPQEKLEHQTKAAKKTQQLLKERGIEWFSIQGPQENSKQSTPLQKKQKKSWLSW